MLFLVSDARLLYQKMFLSMLMTACRVSHLPAVNYRIQRRIKKCKSKCAKRKSFENDTRAFYFRDDQRDQVRQITKQKYEIYIEYTDRRFNEASKICYIADLCYLSVLAGPKSDSCVVLQLNKA